MSPSSATSCLRTCNLANISGRKSIYSSSFLLLLLVLLGCCNASYAQELTLSKSSLTLILGSTDSFKLTQYGNFSRELSVSVHGQHQDIVEVVPSQINLSISENNQSITYDLFALGRNPGKTELLFNVTPPDYIDISQLFLRVTVMQSHLISVISEIMGWVYFLAWSVSFYPQIWSNFKRKSVVGLNFDFLALNILGFILYSVFNCGMYFSPEIQGQYFTQHPRGVNPVHLNDVFFSLHAAFATCITIVQCFVYEREDQEISYVGRSLLAVFGIALLVCAVLASIEIIIWLEFLYICGYIKLTITFIKYVPQAYMNYKRKSTIGWSIGNIFLDFTGGSLSILQMLLDAFNYDDWHSIFGDVTKFGLGAFSLFFDIFFMLQHYVFYRLPPYTPIPSQPDDIIAAVNTDNRSGGFEDEDSLLEDGNSLPEDSRSYQNYVLPT